MADWLRAATASIRSGRGQLRQQCPQRLARQEKVQLVEALEQHVVHGLAGQRELRLLVIRIEDTVLQVVEQELLVDRQQVRVLDPEVQHHVQVTVAIDVLQGALHRVRAGPDGLSLHTKCKLLGRGANAFHACREHSFIAPHEHLLAQLTSGRIVVVIHSFSPRTTNCCVIGPMTS